MSDMLRNTIELQVERLHKQKEEFVLKKLAEKGFAHLVKGIEKRRFPKLAAVTCESWTYYYADNDTDEGAFIVAIKDYAFETDWSCEQNAMSISAEWQDTEPLKITEPWQK